MIKEMSSSPPLVVITGPSGVGKDTILDILTEELPNLYVPITATTRKPRPNEIHGIDQLFYDNKEFDLLGDYLFCFHKRFCRSKKDIQ